MKTSNIEQQDPARKILARIYGGGRDAVFTPKDFLDLAGPETVRQALGRLARSGKIRRLLRGVYDYPSFSKLLQAPASPDPHAIGRAIAHAHGWTILPAGETALNLLGLSTQVPARWEYFSDGPSKRYTWAGGTLVFKHRANRETTILSSRTGLLVQALLDLGSRVEQCCSVWRAKAKSEYKPMFTGIKTYTGRISVSFEKRPSTAKIRLGCKRS